MSEAVQPIVTVTEAARRQIARLLSSEGRDDLALRMAIVGRGGPGGFQYRLGFVGREEKTADDQVIEAGGFEIYVDPGSVDRLRGASIDYVDELQQSGFRIDNPNSPWSDPRARAVQELLDREINPAIAAHGGFIQLLDVKDDVVYISMGGGCHGCGMADVTLRQGVEVRIKEEVPGIRAVVDTTDHAGGTNPYYRAAQGGASPLA